MFPYTPIAQGVVLISVLSAVAMFPLLIMTSPVDRNNRNSELNEVKTKPQMIPLSNVHPSGKIEQNMRLGQQHYSLPLVKDASTIQTSLKPATDITVSNTMERNRSNKLPGNGFRLLRYIRKSEPNTQTKSRVSSPGEVIERVRNGLRRTVQNTASILSQMVGNKMRSMAITGESINRGIVITGRSIRNILKDMFN